MDWMQPFCAAGTEGFGRPFRQGEWSYATDSCVAVRVPSREHDSELASPDMAKLFDRLFEAQRYVHAPALDLPKATIVKSTCSTCSGSGRVHACPECQCRCSRCAGSGRITIDSDATASVTLPSGSYARNYVRRIWSLPGLLIGVGVQPGLALPFAFEGHGQGLLMPQTTPYSDNIIVSLTSMAA